MEEDGLRKGSRQQKLVDLFAPYFEGQDSARLDSTVLNEPDRRRYLDILSGPIQTHVKKAAKQLKATKHALGRPDLTGGLIVPNRGFSTLAHEDFATQVVRYSTKDTSQIDDVISISVWADTNGFDLIVNHAFCPHNGGSSNVQAIREAFHSWFEGLMTDLMQGKQLPDLSTMSPSRSTAFTIGGVTFRWEPESVPLTMK